MASTNFKATARRILFKIGTAALWSKYNLKGTGDKEGMEGSCLYRVIVSKYDTVNILSKRNNMPLSLHRLILLAIINSFTVK